MLTHVKIADTVTHLWNNSIKTYLNYKSPMDNAIRFICFQKSHLTLTWSSARSLRSLGWEDPLEKETATHSNILAWKIPWTIWSMGFKEPDMTEQLSPPQALNK